MHEKLDPSGSAILRLSPGSWTIRIESQGYWSERRALQVTEEDEVLELRMLPGAKLAGTLSVPRGENAPTEIDAEFRLVTPGQADLGVEEGGARCELDEELRFECLLPAAVLDVGLRAPTFVTQWLWSRSLERGEVADVGTVELRRGSSVSGWIEIREGQGDPRDTSLRLKTVRLPGSGSPARERDRELLELTTRANRRGHFAFEGVPPGSYELHAELEGYAPVRRTGIPVMAESESVIGEPIRLFFSRELRVSVSPPLDPEGREWTVELTSLEDPDTEGLEAVMDGGDAVLASVVPGRYSVRLVDHRGIQRWWREEQIEPGQGELWIQVESYSVRGRVLFGSDGIPAQLIFGGSRGAVSIPVTATEEGEFLVDLPRAGSWKVDVEGSEVRGTKWVDVPRNGTRSSPARVEIVFPDNEIAGRVIDGLGAPVGGARVLVFSAGELRLEQSRADGTFVLRGIPEGEAVLVASVEPDGGAHERRIEVRATGRIDGLQLILEDRVQLSGMVEATTGGVPDALVLALSDDPTGLKYLPAQTFTEREGFFELWVPADATRLRVAVLAPGFPLNVLSVPVEPGLPLILPVGGEGGELVFRPGFSHSLRAPGSLLVFHRGFALDIGTLMMWARRNGSMPNEEEIRVPRLSPGMYRVCTEIDPRSFVKVLLSENAAAGSGECRRLRVHDGSATEVDLEEMAD